MARWDAGNDDWDEAGFTDDVSELLPTWFNAPRGGCGIFAPRTAEIVETSENGPAILYPVPAAQRDGVSSEQDLSFLDSEDWIRREGDARHLIGDFAQLAEGTADAVRDFVLRWGPLWMATDMRLFVFSGGWDGMDDIRPHVWKPAESVSWFIEEAKRLQSVLNIAACLVQEKSPPAEYWAGVYYDQPTGLSQSGIRLQRIMIARVVNQYLAEAAGPRLVLDWEYPQGVKDRDYPAKLAIDTGLGFLRLAWWQAAQHISSGRNLYVCSGCGVGYIREAKAPPAGKRNYCPRCTESHIPQRDAMRDARAKKRLGAP